MRLGVLALALTACTGGKDSAGPAASTATSTASSTDTTVDTGMWVDPGTGTGTSTDMVTSCNVTARKLCVEFVNYTRAASWCNTHFGTVAGSYAAGACPTAGRVQGRCTVDGEASGTDAYDVDATVYYYTGIADAAASCTEAGGSWSAAR